MQLSIETDLINLTEKKRLLSNSKRTAMGLSHREPKGSSSLNAETDLRSFTENEKVNPIFISGQEFEDSHRELKSYSLYNDDKS